MPAVVDPVSGLEFYELSHRWGMYTPIFPGYEEIKLERITHHAKQGVMTHKITTIFHTSTHVNAPLHLVPGAPGVGELELQRFFGTGVVVSIPKRKWELIEPSDLERAKPQHQVRRHRPHRYRLASQILRQQGIFRSCARIEQARGGLVGEEARQAPRHRHRNRRSSARDVARSAPQRPADQISPSRNTGRRPAARRSTIFRNGIRRTGRCSQPVSRPSRMSAAISMSSQARAAPSRAFPGSGARATPA